MTGRIFQALLESLFFFFLMGFVFCDSYYPIDKGASRGGGLARVAGVNMGGGDKRKRIGRGGQHGPRGARARKDRRRGTRTEGGEGARAKKDQARESSTGALCTKFTLV